MLKRPRRAMLQVCYRGSERCLSTGTMDPFGSSWNNPNLCIPSGAQVWYTDGSKLENGDTGAGVYGPRFRRFCALEQETSEHVLCECPALCRRRLQILGGRHKRSNTGRGAEKAY
ncbi:hypothetical protein ACLKA6_017016 [Drosophila palustris]